MFNKQKDRLEEQWLPWLVTGSGFNLKKNVTNQQAECCIHIRIIQTRSFRSSVYQNWMDNTLVLHWRRQQCVSKFHMVNQWTTSPQYANFSSFIEAQTWWGEKSHLKSQRMTFLQIQMPEMFGPDVSRTPPLTFISKQAPWSQKAHQYYGEQKTRLTSTGPMKTMKTPSKWKPTQFSILKAVEKMRLSGKKFHRAIALLLRRSSLTVVMQNC